MLYTEPYKTFESSLSNAKNVLSLEWLYDGLKQFLGKFFLLLLLFFLALPFVFLFGYWVQRKRKKFQKHMRTDALLLVKNAKNYTEFKANLNKLESLMPALKKVGGYNYKKTPLFLRYTLGQMQKMSSTLVTYTDWLKGRLNPLNTEQFKSGTKEFKFLPEKELWNKRNKAYEYWM